MKRDRNGNPVSNPISGEVGAAATSSTSLRLRSRKSFKPHQRGGGCCSHLDDWSSGHGPPVSNPISGEVGAAAVLPIRVAIVHIAFQTPSAGRWVLQPADLQHLGSGSGVVSNPISGEVGAAAGAKVPVFLTHGGVFQTPSAGRWVLQQSTEIINAITTTFVSNPISGEVGAAARLERCRGQGPRPRVSNPISGEVGAAATTPKRPSPPVSACFKPHQRGGGCCSLPE